ncbi:MAG TPA: hypothetical protein VIM01_06375 [Dermatophilaceae bacterium]
MTVEDSPSVTPWQPLVQIGDISVDQRWVVTPSGSIPTGRVTWTVQDMTRRDRVIPTYAIVLAVVFSVLTCLLGLLFLLIKEDRTTGWLQVTVQGPELVHTTHVPRSTRDRSPTSLPGWTTRDH